MGVGITDFRVRKYEEKDLNSVVAIYKSAFAEPPWNENWQNNEVIAGLRKCLCSLNPIVLVAKNSSDVVGLTWGFNCCQDKFPFLDELYFKNTSYIAELAVDPSFREKGIGGLLGASYVESAKNSGANNVILRTDERNPAAMRLYKSLGFNEVDTRDPEFSNRIYLAKTLEDCYD